MSTTMSSTVDVAFLKQTIAKGQQSRSLTGHVVHIVPEKGYGFITTSTTADDDEERADYYFHFSQVKHNTHPHRGDLVSFHPAPTRRSGKGPSATCVRVLAPEQQKQDTIEVPRAPAPKAVVGETSRSTEAKVMELSHTVEILQKANAKLREEFEALKKGHELRIAQVEARSLRNETDIELARKDNQQLQQKQQQDLGEAIRHVEEVGQKVTNLLETSVKTHLAEALQDQAKNITSNIVQQLQAAGIGPNGNHQQTQKETRRPPAAHHENSGGGEAAQVTTPRRQGQQANTEPTSGSVEQQTQEQRRLDSPSSGQKNGLSPLQSGPSLSRKKLAKTQEGKRLDFNYENTPT
ncbi:unnamed protein product [Amoebophrya sp. A120]|nr:unnamed protein product [Amoebophrya sp. A120]|eukprot:GSA120T00001267001.1